MAAGGRTKSILRWFGGGALLVLILWLAGPEKLLRTLAGVDSGYFALALALSILSNLASAVRWAHLARLLGLVAPTARLVVLYARGITVNAILPGATLSGDVLRSYQLHRMGNPLLQSGISVLFDRVSGLWVLCVLSLFAAGVAGWGGAGTPWGKTFYFAAVLALGIASPFLFAFGRWWQRLALPKVVSAIDRCAEALHVVLRSRIDLAKQLAFSLTVQALSASALWLCGLAAGLAVPFWVMAAVAAPIFIMAAIPTGLGGWGTRELAAIVLLGGLGQPAELAAATGILYGLCALAQAVLAVPLMMKRFDVAAGDG
jgi:uncharacterized membrane protein YbhN (UPF0104 family)